MEKTKEIQITGNVLYLTQNPSLIRKQLEGTPLRAIDEDTKLVEAISTDIIIPNHACYSCRNSKELSEYLLTGLGGGGIIERGEIKKGGFEAIVAGQSFGRGSSREHAQLALLGAGIRYVLAPSFERIFGENCRNYGILTIDSRFEEFARRLLEGEKLPFRIFLEEMNPLNRLVLEHGGLVQLAKDRMQGEVEFTPENTTTRPMTIAEKIIASHVVKTPDSTYPTKGVDFVKPGQTAFVRIDMGYAYELQSHVGIEAIRRVFGEDFVIRHPERFFFFEDHLALLNTPNAPVFRQIQSDFAEKSGAHVYKYQPQIGVEGICHTVMLEKHALPGQLIVGNDSHTCTLGAVGALAIGKGSSELSASFLTGDVALTVPETIRFNLEGSLRGGVTSKDLMLYILAKPELRQNLLGSGRVFEFGGSALDYMPFDEQIVLANMTIEGNGFTGIVEPNEQTKVYLGQRTNLSRSQIENLLVKSDRNAEYVAEFTVNLKEIEPMVAMPGDTQNGVPLSWVKDTAVNIAYIGSCTGGKLEDLIRAAKILSGRRVSPDVDFYVQASSQSIKRAAEGLGLLEVFRKCGAKFLEPGCGACMNAGPGSSTNETQVTISDTNRNFPGRMGRGKTYLSNVEVVAASAIAGKITPPEEL